MLLITVTTASIKVMVRDERLQNTTVKSGVIGGYKTERVMGDIIKLENDKSLVYIKPIEQFYEADHNPMICWKGSGYELEGIKEEWVAGMRVFTATLQKEHEKLYTAWWYDNGSLRTTSQLEWRWKMLQQARHFSLVNITCSTREELQKQVKLFIQKNEIYKSFHSRNVNGMNAIAIHNKAF